MHINITPIKTPAPAPAHAGGAEGGQANLAPQPVFPELHARFVAPAVQDADHHGPDNQAWQVSRLRRGDDGYILVDAYRPVREETGTIIAKSEATFALAACKPFGALQ